MNSVKWIAVAVLVVAPFAAMRTASAQQQPIVIKFSHVVAADTPKGKGALRFKELAEERTNGRVKIEVYPNSTLYKDNEEIEALQVGAMLFKKLESKGIRGLAYWDNGFKVMSANKPLHMPADFKGLKMRIQSSKVLDAQMRALGALPQVMAFSETYQALQTGVVDGTEGPPSNLYTQKMNEVQKYVAVSNHGYLGYAVIVNKKFWEGLPADIRTGLEAAMKDATRYTNAIAQQENDQALAKVKATGRTQVYDLTPAEVAAWKKVLVPVQDEMKSRIGKDVIEAVQKEAAALGVK